MKKIKIVLIVLCLVFLTSCAKTKSSITGDKFKEIIENNEYKITDVSSNYDYAISAYNAYKDEVSIFFLKGKKKYDVEGIFIDEYQNIYSQVGDKYEKKLTSGTSWTSLKLISDDKLYYLSWVDDSYIIITSLKNKENEVDKIINLLGY